MSEGEFKVLSDQDCPVDQDRDDGVDIDIVNTKIVDRIRRSSNAQRDAFETILMLQDAIRGSSVQRPSSEQRVGDFGFCSENEE